MTKPDTSAYNAQVRKFTKKLTKLRKALNFLSKIQVTNYESAKQYTNAKDHLLNKMADVQIELYEMQYLLNADIAPIVQQKIKQTTADINKGEKD